MTTQEEHLMRFLEDFVPSLKDPEWMTTLLEAWQIAPWQSEALRACSVSESYSRSESVRNGDEEEKERKDQTPRRCT